MDALEIFPRLEQKLEKGFDRLKNDYARVIRHQRRVSEICGYISEEMQLSPERNMVLRIAARYHDYTKSLWPFKVSRAKKEDLTQEEILLIYAHPETACEILANDLAEDTDVLDWFDKEKVFDIIRYHHKDEDGNGYPETKSCARVPLEAKILRVADSYDAMRSPRPYRSRKNRMMSHDTAASILVEKSGTEFSPEIVDNFLKISSKKLDNLYVNVRDLTSLHVY